MASRHVFELKPGMDPVEEIACSVGRLLEHLYEKPSDLRTGYLIKVQAVNNNGFVNVEVTLEKQK